MYLQGNCLGDQPTSHYQVTVSNGSTLTRNADPLRSSDNAQSSRASCSSKFYEHLAGTLSQVVFKYVNVDKELPAVGSNSVHRSLVDSSNCFLTTEVSHSEDSTTLPVSSFVDTATSLDSARLLSIPVEALEPCSGAEMFCNSPIFNQNNDKLQSIFPSTVSFAMHTNDQQADWPCSNLNQPSVTHLDTWNGVTYEPSESWGNLCELPAVWQYYADPEMVANDMEGEMIDVTHELAMRTSSDCRNFQDNDCGDCFTVGNWEFSHCDTAESSMSAINGDEYFCKDKYTNHGDHVDMSSFRI